MKAPISQSVTKLVKAFVSNWPASVGIPGRILSEYVLFIYFWSTHVLYVTFTFDYFRTV